MRRQSVNNYSQESIFFFFNDTATTEIYTLSLHDALPISAAMRRPTWSAWSPSRQSSIATRSRTRRRSTATRSEEHTSELQSRLHLVCRLLLEKKKKKLRNTTTQCAHITYCSRLNTTSKLY